MMTEVRALLAGATELHCSIAICVVSIRVVVVVVLPHISTANCVACICGGMMLAHCSSEICVRRALVGGPGRPDVKPAGTVPENALSPKLAVSTSPDPARA